jgi:hypothetical protein
LIELISKISLIKLIEKGPPKFIMIKKNQNRDKAGIVPILPLLIIDLREWLRSYIILAQENIPGEVIP